MSLSTRIDKESVNGLKRDGVLYEFEIEKDIFDLWLEKGYIERIIDLDHGTGVTNQELRFTPEIAPELNKYKSSTND